MKRWLGVYAEGTFSKIKGKPVDDAEGTMDDLYFSIVVGGTVHFGFGR